MYPDTALETPVFNILALLSLDLAMNLSLSMFLFSPFLGMELLSEYGKYVTFSFHSVSELRVCLGFQKTLKLWTFEQFWS